MTTPARHEGEPFAEAAAEAVQTSVMAVRLVLTIADAVRREAQKRSGEEKELPLADVAMSQAAGDLKSILPPDVATALMADANWPQMAQQLMALQGAGVDMEDLLPRLGGVAVTVRDAVAANAAAVAREGTQEWADLLRETMPEGLVRDAVLSSPAWPEIAGQMAKLQERGVDVRELLTGAHAEGVGVDQAVARVMASEKSATAGAEPAASRDALTSYGPLTMGVEIPKNLDLSDREKALRQLGVEAPDNARYVRLVREALPDRERETALLTQSRQWPLLAAKMAQLEQEGKPLAQHLERLGIDREWQEGSASQVGSRLVQATSEVLRTPVGERVSRVSGSAARSQSTTVSAAAGPTKASKKGAPSAEPAVAPHRSPAASPSAGRSK